MRFSSRLSWESTENPLSRLLAAKRAQRAHVHDLTLSNPTRAGIAYPADDVVRAFDSPALLAYDPAPRGSAGALAAVCAHERRRGRAARAEDVILCASTSEAYSWLFKLLCDPGDTVLAPAPSYPLFDYLAGLESVRLAHYRLAYDGAWHVDFASVDEGVAAGARAILAVSPNNPTGSMLSAEERARLAERGLPLVIDEVFADYPFRDAPAPAPPAPAPPPAPSPVLTFRLGGRSKSAGRPQMKLAWIIVDGPDDARHAALRGLETIADSFLSVSTPVAVAAPRLLAAGELVRQAILARVRANLAWIAGRIPAAGSPVSLLASDGGWSAVLRVPATRTDEELALALLSEHDVLVHPGYLYDFERGAHLVVSLLTPPADLHAGIGAILASHR
jgi:aspartate/methionine/tyrosine aminotransferase